ncbi:MAG TPA: aspartate oxidase, partial [Solirubrobacteraceae bacterium]
HRAALAALGEPGAPSVGRASVVELDAHVEEATRTALWERAGLARTREGLETLAGDPHPLARLIAACALAREESRGAHMRTDHRAADPRLDGLHTIVDPGGGIRFERWD